MHFECGKKLTNDNQTTRIFSAYLACAIMSPLDEVRIQFWSSRRIEDIGYHQGQLQEAPTAFTTAVSGIMTQRMILNLRASYTKSCNAGEESTFDLRTWQAPNFSEPLTPTHELQAMEFESQVC